VRGVAQALEHRPGGALERVVTIEAGKLRQPRADREPAIAIALDKPMHLKRNGQPIGSGSREPAARHQLGERCRAVSEAIEDDYCLVKHANAATLCHIAILPYQYVRCKYASVDDVRSS
jgi:hypothetical protein